MNQLQENIKQPVEAAFNEFVGNFSGSMLGFAQQLNLNIDWQTGTTQNAVTLRFPGTTGTSNTTDLTIIGLPTNLWPSTTQVVLFRVIDNGASSVGLMTVTTEGLLTFVKDVSGSVFTASGSKGVGTMSVTYIRDI